MRNDGISLRSGRGCVPLALAVPTLQSASQPDFLSASCVRRRAPWFGASRRGVPVLGTALARAERQRRQSLRSSEDRRSAGCSRRARGVGTKGHHSSSSTMSTCSLDPRLALASQPRSRVAPGARTFKMSSAVGGLLLAAAIVVAARKDRLAARAQTLVASICWRCHFAVARAEPARIQVRVHGPGANHAADAGPRTFRTRESMNTVPVTPSNRAYSHITVSMHPDRHSCVGIVSALAAASVGVAPLADDAAAAAAAAARSWRSAMRES